MMTTGIRVMALLVGIGFLLSLAACKSSSDAERVGGALEDRLSDAIRIEGGTSEPGPPPQPDTGSAAPQIDRLDVPDELQLGEFFMLRLSTGFDEPDKVAGAVVYVTGATTHINVSNILHTRKGAFYMDLAGMLAPDILLKGKDFALSVALLLNDGTVGGYRSWKLQVLDLDPILLTDTDTSPLSMPGASVTAGDRPAASDSPDVPQVDEVDSPEQVDLNKDFTISLHSANTSNPAVVKAIIVGAPATPVYATLKEFAVAPGATGYWYRVTTAIETEKLAGTTIVFMFGLQDDDGNVGRYVPVEIYVKSVDDKTPDGDTPTPDGDDSPDDGDIDGDAQPTCTCSEKNACCDGCLPINDGGGCADDELRCTRDVCAAGVCRHRVDPSYCVIAGACVPDGTLNIDNACELCKPALSQSTWQTKGDGSVCDDGNLCTTGDSCQSGQCVAGSPVQCPEAIGCMQAGVCNPTTGNCDIAPKEDGSGCDDELFCTINDNCQSGQCVGGGARDCSQLDRECAIGVCDEGANACQTEAKADDLPCSDDNDVCTTDVCQNGLCSHDRIENDCAMRECGQSASGCYDCGACDAFENSYCTPDFFCDCAPTSCDDLGVDCGTYANGCGGTIDCGGCADPTVCYDSGICAPDKGGPCGDMVDLTLRALWPMAGHCPTHQGRGQGRGAQNNTIRWSFPTNGEIRSQVAVAENGDIYAGSLDGYLYAIDPFGSQLWRYPSTATITTTPAIRPDGSIVFTSTDGFLYAVTSNGGDVWRFMADSALNSSPVVDDSGNVFFVSSLGTVYKISNTGEEEWNTPLAVSVGSGAISLLPDDWTVFGDDAGVLHALDERGAEVWTFASGDAITGGISMGADGTLYFTSNDGYLYGVSADGLDSWRVQLGSTAKTTPTIGPDGTLYVGSDQSQLYAIGADGESKWSLAIGDPARTVAIDDTGTLFVATVGGRMHSVSPDGAINWTATIGDTVPMAISIGYTASVAVTTSGGQVVVIGDACESDCTDKQCGDDGCGGSCADCGPYANAIGNCNDSFVCEMICEDGFGDCVNGMADGCETHVLDNNTFCGPGCVTCTDGMVCIDGNCQPPADGDSDDETDGDGEDLACTEGPCCDPDSNTYLATGSACIGDWDDGKVCTQALCDSAHQCIQTPNATTCFIDNECYGLGETNLSKPCEACIPTTSQEVWTTLADSATCDDGLACTENDRCLSGVCSGTSADCSSFSDACNSAACAEPGGCYAVPRSGVCDDDLFCTINTSCQSGLCLGDARDCTGACFTGTCDEDNDHCEWITNNTPCDDLDPTTVNDVCTDGVCAGSLAGMISVSPITDERYPDHAGKFLVDRECSPSHDFTISNVGPGPLTLSAISVVDVMGADVSSFVVPDFAASLPLTLQSSQSFAFPLSFCPKTIQGLHRLTLAITSDDNDFPVVHVYYAGDAVTCDYGHYDVDPHIAGCEYFCMPPFGHEDFERCDAYDNNCDGTINEGWDIGQPCTGTGICGAGAFECADDFTQICSTDPGGSSYNGTAESCNDLDDDCDGETDEDFQLGSPCHSLGLCGLGVWECDESGSRRCSTEPGGSDDKSIAELCNGLDDDCDGLTDNGDFIDTNMGSLLAKPIGMVCSGEGTGCEGTYVCADETNWPDLKHVTCSTSFTTVVEVCDGYDTDCDGTADTGFNTNTTCDGVGECQTGYTICEPGNPLGTICSTDIGGPDYVAKAEICDRLDNDCDGLTDEDFPIGQSCQPPGACPAGVFECSISEKIMVCSTAPGGTDYIAVAEDCDGFDNDCDGLTDEDEFGDPLMKTCSSVCETGYQKCTDSGWSDCNARQPETEVCDGKDNNCDGSVDEPWSVNESCSGTGICGSGFYQCYNLDSSFCSTEPFGFNDQSVPERCNDAIDNDCDGLTDEFETFEVCDGFDNNCDGQTDEGFTLNVSCMGVGECGVGVTECGPKWDLICSTDIGGSAYPDSPPAEECNGLDDDCDGITDNSYGIGEDCDGLGECGVGRYECRDLYAAICSTEPGGSDDQSTTERCNGLDDDCDGMTDEDFNIGYWCEGIGDCMDGVLECATEFTTVCSTYPGGSNDMSSPEVCDGADNDCNGLPDDGITCP